MTDVMTRAKRIETAARRVDVAYRDFRSSLPFQPREAVWDLFSEKLAGPLAVLSVALEEDDLRGQPLDGADRG